MADIALQSPLCYKTAEEFLHIGHGAAAIVTDVYDQAVACGQQTQNPVQISGAYAGRKRWIVDVAHILRQHAIHQRTNAAVIEVEIMFLNQT